MPRYDECRHDVLAGDSEFLPGTGTDESGGPYRRKSTPRKCRSQYGYRCLPQEQPRRMRSAQLHVGHFAPAWMRNRPESSPCKKIGSCEVSFPHKNCPVPHPHPILSPFYTKIHPHSCIHNHVGLPKLHQGSALASGAPIGLASRAEAHLCCCCRCRSCHRRFRSHSCCLRSGPADPWCQDHGLCWPQGAGLGCVSSIQ